MPRHRMILRAFFDLVGVLVEGIPSPPALKRNAMAAVSLGTG